MSEKSSSSDGMVLIVVFALILIGVFYFFRLEIYSAYLTLKLWQLQAIAFIFNDATKEYVMGELINKPISEWEMGEVSAVGTYVGRRISVIYILVFGLIAYKAWATNPLKTFRRVFTMKSLRKNEMSQWPFIAPIVNLDLVNEKHDEGPYAMSIKPYNFAVKYKLLPNIKDTKDLDLVKTEKIMASQLGRIYDGMKSMKPHERALFLIFIAHGLGDKKGAMKAIGEIAISAHTNPKRMPNFSSTKVLEKHLENPEVQEILEKHAYVATILCEALVFARTKGVFPPSYIIWLKPRDRRLFYALNNVGRQVAWVEVAGIYGHWLAERVLGKKIETPYVEKAVEGLALALADVAVP